MAGETTIGVLSLQGGYAAHSRILTTLGVTTRNVRRAEELDGLDGLIMPGGESTTMLKFLGHGDFFARLKAFVHTTPTFGTCAGAILLAKDIENSAQDSFGALDIAVERNAYGRQNDSAILHEPSSLGGEPLEMVFIRAPRITRTGPGVEVLAKRDDDPALVRQGHLLATTFHPELGHDDRVHRLFVEMCRIIPSPSGRGLG